MRLLFTSVMFVTATLSSISAQQSADTAQRSSGRSYYMAGGVELGRLFYPGSYPPGHGPGQGLSLQTGTTWHFARWDLRVGLGYYERERLQHLPAFDAFAEHTYAFQSRTLAANADITHDFAHSSVRPYVLGGLTLFRASVTSHFDGGQPSTVRRVGAAFTPGLGLRFPLRGTEAFAEMRLQLLGGYSYVVLPLTFGVRF